MLIMVILGGKGTLIGPVLGAVLFTFLPELLREASHYRMLIFATILIVATLFMPRGHHLPGGRAADARSLAHCAMAGAA